MRRQFIVAAILVTLVLLVLILLQRWTDGGQPPPTPTTIPLVPESATAELLVLGLIAGWALLNIYEQWRKRGDS